MKLPPVAPIAVQPIGPIATAEIRRLLRLLDERWSASARVLEPTPLDERAWSCEREQFDADVLLEGLFDRLPERCLRILGVTEQDLFITGRTFVFGYAHLTDGMALYSVKRLREEFYGRPPALAVEDERVRRAVVHELGHTFGVPHCDHPRCCMHAVTQVDSLDALTPDYCQPCGARVDAGLNVAPWSARGRYERGLAHFRRRRFERARTELLHAVRAAPLETRYREALDLTLQAACGAAVEESTAA
jgi:archaemetzincin